MTLSMTSLDFLQLVRAEWPWVRRKLRALRVRPADLDDVAQEVFLDLHATFDRFYADRPLRPWLGRIVLRAAADYRRRACFWREVLGQLPDDAPDPSPDAETQTAERRALRCLRTRLGQLDPARREVFLLHDVDGVPMPEVARALALPLNTGYSRLRLARRDLLLAAGER